jgi:hypothetical protein
LAPFISVYFHCSLTGQSAGQRRGYAACRAVILKKIPICNHRISRAYQFVALIGCKRKVNKLARHQVELEFETVEIPAQAITD